MSKMMMMMKMMSNTRGLLGALVRSSKGKSRCRYVQKLWGMCGMFMFRKVGGNLVGSGSEKSILKFEY